MSLQANNSASKNAATSSLAHQRGHVVGTHQPGNDATFMPVSYNAADSAYANSDAITTFYLHKQPLSSGTQQPAPHPQVVPSSVAGEYASLCIATSSPVDRQNNMASSQAQLRPALFRLSDGFDYDLPNPDQLVLADNHSSRLDAVVELDSSPYRPGSRNRNSASCNASADLADVSALDQISGGATYGEYASTNVALGGDKYDPDAVDPAFAFGDPSYLTSDEDELDEPDGHNAMGISSFQMLPGTSANAASQYVSSSNGGHANGRAMSLFSGRPLPATESNGVVDENNWPPPAGSNNFSQPAPSLSTFTGSSTNGHHSSTNGHGGRNSTTAPNQDASQSNGGSSRFRNSHVAAARNSIINTSGADIPSSFSGSASSSTAVAVPSASSSSSSQPSSNATPPSPANASSMTTAGSGLQVSYQVRRQLIEAALSGGSGSITPVAPSVPLTTTADSGVNCALQQHSNNNHQQQQQNNAQPCQQQQQQQPSQRSTKDIGHLDMSQYSNLEGKVLPNLLNTNNARTSNAGVNKAPPVNNNNNNNNNTNEGGAYSNSLPMANQTSRNKILTSSSRKGRSGSGSKEIDPSQLVDASIPEQPVPALPGIIPELSERLAREASNQAKALAGRRSMVLSANSSVLPSTTGALTTSTTSAISTSRQSTALPQSGVMSQSMHAGSIASSGETNKQQQQQQQQPQQQQQQAMPTMLDVSRHHGQIRWTKIIENGKRIKKTWTIYYCVFFASPPRLYFFKDEKSAAKSPPPAAGNLLKPHQELSVPAMWSACSQADLPAKLQFTRRKNVIFLATPIHAPSSAPSATTSAAAPVAPSESTPPSTLPGFPDVGAAFLVEAPNAEQAELWLRGFTHFGGLLKYSSSVLPASPPTGSKEHHHHHQVTDVVESYANKSAAIVQSIADVAVAASTAAGKAVTSRARAGSNGVAKGSLMKLLTGFFKRRPTMEHLKKKGYIRELVFGSTLDNICRRERSEVPAFVVACISDIEARGLETDGLYRTSGNLAQVQKLRCMVDQGQTIVWDKWEIAVLTGALKMFFRELREPLITLEVYEKLTEYATRPDLRRSLDPAGREAYLRHCLAMLPPIHFSTARYLFGHFVHVLEHSSANRMELQSLAIVVAPNLMAPHTDVRSVATHALLQKYIAEDLIQFYYNVFFTPANVTSEPALPQQQQQHQQQQSHYGNSPSHAASATNSANTQSTVPL